MTFDFKGRVMQGRRLPKPGIEVSALGMHWRKGHLLAAEVRGHQGELRGVRLFGGSMALGEPCDATIARGFKDELRVDVKVGGKSIVLESTITHEGRTGHQLLIIRDVRFPVRAFAGQDHIRFFETSGYGYVARWHDLATLDVPGGPVLYPVGLKERLMLARS